MRKSTPERPRKQRASMRGARARYRSMVTEPVPAELKPLLARLVALCGRRPEAQEHTVAVLPAETT